MRDRVVFWCFFLVAVLFRMALAVPFGIFPSKLYQISIYMPVAVLLSTAMITYGVTRRVVDGSVFLLLVILLSGPVLLAYSVSTRDAPFIVLSLIATLNSILCSFVLLKTRNKYSLDDSNLLRNIAVGLVTGVVICVVFDLVAFSFGSRFDFGQIGGKLTNGTMIFAVMLFLAPVFEEPIFRGLLIWPRSPNKVQVATLFVLQFALFWLGHLYFYGGRNLDFFVLVPLCAVLFGIVALRTKSLIPSIVAHSFVNAFYVQFVTIRY